MWLLLAALSWPALAQEDELPVGSLVIDTSRTARLEVVPRTDPQLVEIVITGNAKPVDLQLDEQRTAHVRDAWAVTAGSGTWFATLVVTSPNIAVDARRDALGRWVLHTEERPRSQVVDAPPPPSVDALVADAVPRTPARPPSIPLLPLLGDVWGPRMDARHVRLPVGPWKPDVSPVPDEEASQGLIDALRRALVLEEDPERRTFLMQRLGVAYQELGLHREARFYFDEVALQKTDWPRDAVRVHQADASLATGRWEAAMEHCRSARAAGADDATTLACLGGVSLATGAPAPTWTGRALVKASEVPEHRLLAAQLLILDNRFAEARPLVEGLEGLSPELRRYRDATLGDVYLALGDLEAARGAWRDVGTRGLLGDLAEQRARLIRMSKEPPATWAAELPALEKTGREGGPAGAEALQVAAQVANTYDEAEVAARHLTTLVDRWPDIAARSDIPQRLLDVCDRRIQNLQRADRLIEAVGFYRDCWRDELDPLVYDISTQRQVAATFRSLGLWEPALEAQRDVTAALARDDREEVLPLLELARLYVRVERPVEALETVAYASRLPGAGEHRGLLALVSGLAHHANGELDAALRDWARASTDPEARVEARVHRALALAEAGRCAEAQPVLAPIAKADEILDEHDITVPDARLAIARCLVDQGRADEALAMASSLGDSRGDWAVQARWLAAVAAFQEPGAPPPEPPLEPSDAWREAIEEMRRIEDVERRVERLRR